MLLYGGKIYILGAQSNEIQILNASDSSILGTIELNTNGFSKGLKKVDGMDLAIVSDLKQNMYSIIDLKSDKVIAAYSVNVPIKDVVITDKVRLFE